MITYSVDQSVVVNVNTTNYIEAGIIGNAELTNVRYSQTDKGSEFMEFTFTNDTGAKLIQTEYKPKGNTPEEVETRTRKQIIRIKQIICGYDDKNKVTTTFIDPKQYVIHANDFKTFCEETISILGKKYVGKKLRIKAVYNDNGFVTLPKYSTYAFIEPMSIPKEKSLLKILSIDKMTRPVQTEPRGSSNPFETNSPKGIPSNPVNDLPF